MRSIALGVVIAAAVAGGASAEPLRAERTQLLAGGLSVAKVGGGQEFIPYVTVQAAWNTMPTLAVTADVGYFGTDDRLFGPRLKCDLGARWYAMRGGWAPFVGGQVIAYHEFDVDYGSSDASQVSGSLLGLGGSLGFEWTFGNHLTWLVEARESGVLLASSSVPARPITQVLTTLGYRF